ncbi:hypothetical protein MLS212_04530 [Helicobacter pylori]
MQMLFDKINNGSPFGVIREVFSFSPQLRQFLNNKCHFIGFVEIVIRPIMKSIEFLSISDALLSVVSKDLKKLLSQDQIKSIKCDYNDH